MRCSWQHFIQIRISLSLPCSLLHKTTLEKTIDISPHNVIKQYYIRNKQIRNLVTWKQTFNLCFCLGHETPEITIPCAFWLPNQIPANTAEYEIFVSVFAKSDVNWRQLSINWNVVNKKCKCILYTQVYGKITSSLKI